MLADGPVNMKKTIHLLFLTLHNDAIYLVIFGDLLCQRPFLCTSIKIPHEYNSSMHVSFNLINYVQKSMFRGSFFAKTLL